MDKQMWLVYAIAAGLCWGTYVPFVQQGIRGLGGNALGSYLCVGVAYFLIAVLFPLGMFYGFGERQPNWNMWGISFATLAGVAGALGALFVIYANKNAPPGSDYRPYIAPVIFALAPVLNTLVSSVWHPSYADGAVFHFEWRSPSWKLWLGILLTGVGAALVLYSKEEAESKTPAHSKSAPKPPADKPQGESASLGPGATS